MDSSSHSQDVASVVWVTGLPSSGKSTFARLLAERLRLFGHRAIVLDGDEVRSCLVPPLGYTELARENFYQTLSNLAGYLESQGFCVVVPATAHRRVFRDRARSRSARFIEVYVEVPEGVVRARDEKGLYRAAEEGNVRNLPGNDLAYETPLNPDVTSLGGRDEGALAKTLAKVLGEVTSPLAGK